MADFVIVGGGSAGCVLASRLAQKLGNKKIVLLEAGFSDRSSPLDILVHMPTALAMAMDQNRYNYKFWTHPERHLNNRQISQPRGRGLGGSSSINGMVYVRGHKMDFDTWERMGASGWSYDKVLPYFKRAENWQLGESDFHGANGPLQVKWGDNASGTPLNDAFLAAGAEAGFPITPDYNGADQEGVGKMAMTVFHSGPRKGMRCSASSAYLSSGQSPPSNLKIITRAAVQKILFKGNRAIGVEYLNPDRPGSKESILASEEVIVSAGAFHTPQLLQVSGIGDKDHIRDIGVPLVHHSPFVGRNLQDHMELYFQMESSSTKTLAPYAQNWLYKGLVGSRWLLTRSGLGASNQFETCAFLRSDPEKVDYPDIQFHFLPVAISYDGKSLAPSKTGHSYQIHVGTGRSKSRGTVMARSASMQDAPEIQCNYMSHPEDWAAMRAGIRLARKIVTQPALQHLSGNEIMPGAAAQSDSDLDAFIRDHVESAYHVCGTCRMGDDQTVAENVTDSEGRVHGVSGLRIVDASLFPQVTNGNLNAPVIMVAEKISDDIERGMLRGQA